MKPSRHCTLALRLSSSRAGRVLLHAGVLMRSPGNSRWHLRHILRNLLPSRRRKPKPLSSSCAE
jgi:hypothetical protein